MHSRKQAKAETVRLVVRALLAEWLAAGARSGQYINSGGGVECGCCHDFSDELLMRLSKDDIEGEGICVLNFLSADADGCGMPGSPFDRALLRRYWPAIQPVAGLTWEDLDQLSADADFDSRTHGWTHVGGLHFDAECTEGVENFFDLPFFGRVIAWWRKKQASTAVDTFRIEQCAFPDVPTTDAVVTGIRAQTATAT